MCLGFGDLTSPEGEKQNSPGPPSLRYGAPASWSQLPRRRLCGVGALALGVRFGHFYRPKGENRTAQAFRPGNGSKENRPEGAAEQGISRQRRDMLFLHLTAQSLSSFLIVPADFITRRDRHRVAFDEGYLLGMTSGSRPPFQGDSLCMWFPGLKAWAILYSPFER
jgi:hypothetical protein